MTVDTVEKLFIRDLKDIYSAESQIVDALPKLANAATSEELKEVLEDHLSETEEQVARLEEIFNFLGLEPKGGSCESMNALLAEGARITAETASGALRDAVLIAAVQRVEHYEISAYGSVRAYAKILALENVIDLLDETLKEEKIADSTLTSIADSVNLEALDAA